MANITEYKTAFILAPKATKYVDVNQRKHKLFIENKVKTMKAHTKKPKYMEH